MNVSMRVLGVFVGCAMLLGASRSVAQDWPQWRGPNRDGKATGFKPPANWPEELTQKWKVEVGDGVATPALVGERLYVFTRQGANEIIRCLDAASGEEVWQDSYEARGAAGAARSFAGPRCSPAVADGKVVTLTVRGTLRCLDAADGKLSWDIDDFAGAVPSFYTSSSPMIVDGLCIAQLGGGRGRGGAIAAYDLASGAEKWKWTGEGPAYGSPVLMNVGETKVIIAPTAGKMVALGAADGKELWEIEYSQGRYNAATPVVDGQTLIYAGPRSGLTAVKIEKQGDGLAAKDFWRYSQHSLQFNTPVLKGGLIYGINVRSQVFCVSAEDGEIAWTGPTNEGARGRGSRYGSIVDAGTVLVALTPAAKLVVFEPSGGEYKEIAGYQVAEGGTYAHPILSGNRVFIKDRDSVTLWTVE